MVHTRTILGNKNRTAPHRTVLLYRDVPYRTIEKPIIRTEPHPFDSHKNKNKTASLGCLKSSTLLRTVQLRTRTVLCVLYRFFFTGFTEPYDFNFNPHRSKIKTETRIAPYLYDSTYQKLKSALHGTVVV